MAALARAAAALMLAALALLIAAPAHALDLANNRNLTTFLFPLPGEYWVFGAENSVVWLSVDIPTDLYLTNPFVEAFVSPVLLSSNSPPQWMSIEIPKNNSIVSRAPPASGYTLFLTAAGVGVDIVAVSGQFDIKPSGTTPLSPQHTHLPGTSGASRATVASAAIAAAAAAALLI